MDLIYEWMDVFRGFNMWMDGKSRVARANLLVFLEYRSDTLGSSGRRLSVKRTLMRDGMR